VLIRPAHIHHADLGHGTTAVLNTRTGLWIWLDEDTRRIWDAALSGPPALHTLTDTITARGHHPRQVSEAVQQTLDTLHAHGLLHPYTGPGHPGRRPRTWWGRRTACR
jgi:hypothetical protein